MNWLTNQTINSFVRIFVVIVSIAIMLSLGPSVAGWTIGLIGQWIAYLISFECKNAYLTLSVRFPFIKLAGDPKIVKDINWLHNTMLILTVMNLVIMFFKYGPDTISWSGLGMTFIFNK